MSEIGILQSEFESRILGNRRTVWLQESEEAPTGVLVFLDAEYYLAHVRAAPIVRRALPSVAAAYVSCIDFDVRRPESFCSLDFAAFLAEELSPWLNERFAPEITLAGLSLTGLAAAHAALTYPAAFPRVLCQSASFWWDHNRLVEEVRPTEVAFRITVGANETAEDVDHGQDLIQKESQLASNRAMRDALVDAGHRVSYAEFDGGHDVASWRADLPGSLSALFASPS